ncbi:MAG: thioredoxin-dependent thiol peroxidase [Bacteroidaceae bacterium]|nr:thioredoxin-dependent thiol peroxidase [Bacteroidaceae bacterium]
MLMKVGDKIPALLGKDQTGKDVRAENLRGRKLVLYTYPKDNTSGCTAEACSLRDHKEALAAKGYTILGVSKDSAASHQRFIEAQGLNFDLIADTDTSLLQALGAWGEKKFMGKTCVGTLRTTYLVNEEGVITHIMEPKAIKTKIHAEQILALID